LRSSIVKLVQIAGLHGTIIQNEKYTFQHTTQLFSAYEKFQNAIKLQQQLQQQPLQQSQQQLQQINGNSDENSYISIDKEAKQLFYFLRCISVEHRVSGKIWKSTIGPDKIPNLLKNLSKLLPQQPSVQAQQPQQQTNFDPVDLASIIEDGRKWATVEDANRKWGAISHRTRDNVLTLQFIVSSWGSLYEHINNVVQQSINRKARDQARIAVPLNAFYITHSRFTILSCLHCLVLAGVNPKQTEGPGIPSEHHMVILKRLVATHLKNTIQLSIIEVA